MGIEKTAAATTAATTQSKSTKAKEELFGTREDFLTILLAQLKHQDPLSPMEGTEFIDSITRLSSVEQAINQNNHLERIENFLREKDESFGSPVSYLDKKIDFKSPAFNLKDGQSEFFYMLEERPSDVFVIVKDLDGKIVRRANGTNEIGKNVITWNGKDDAGNQLKDGEYFVEVGYFDKDKNPATVSTITSGIVTGANFESDDIILLVGNIRTTLDKILTIKSTVN